MPTPIQNRADALNCKVAIVDDDPRVRKLLSLSLEELEVEADFFENSFDLLAKICDQSYILLMVDLMMPQMNGVECCRRVRELGYEGKLLVVSALIDAELEQAALDAGADRYFGKSEMFEQLESIIRELGVLN